jgi:hypothetical protein
VTRPSSLPWLAGFTKVLPPPKDTEDPGKFAKDLTASQSLGGLSSYHPPPPPGDAPGAAAKDHPDETRMVIGKDKDGSDGMGGKPGQAARLHPDQESTKMVIGSEKHDASQFPTKDAKDDDDDTELSTKLAAAMWKKKRKMDCGKAAMCGVLVLETG